MSKLIQAYRAARNVKNAQRLRVYERAHPFASCILTREDSDLLADAIAQANREG